MCEDNVDSCLYFCCQTQTTNNGKTQKDDVKTWALSQPSLCEAEAVPAVELAQEHGCKLASMIFVVGHCDGGDGGCVDIEGDGEGESDKMTGWFWFRFAP